MGFVLTPEREPDSVACVDLRCMNFKMLADKGDELSQPKGIFN